MSAKFSIIVPTYNSKNTIEKLLDSIYGQSYKDFEVIVVDDNSCDGTPEIASKYPVRVCILNKNMGAAYARNYGAKEARGDILVFFDSDVILFEDVMSRFNKRFSGSGIKVLIGMYAGEPANPGFLQEFKALQEQAWYDKVPAEKATPFTPYVGAIKKDLFFEAGGFNSGYRDADVEDYEFTIGLIKKAPIHFDRDIKVKHHFPGFKKLIQSYFKRCFLWTEIFLKRKKFENNATTPRQGALCIFYVISAVCFIASFLNIIFLYAGIAFLSLSLFLDKDFLKILYRKKGFLFTFISTILNMFLSFIVVIAAMCGFIYYGIRMTFKRSAHINKV